MTFLEQACEELDATIFNGNDLEDEDQRIVFSQYLKRWERKIKEKKENEQTKAR